MYIRAVTAALALFVACAPAMAQSRACDRLHREYEEADGPKAWAVAPEGCGYASRRSSSSLEEARQKAYEACSENARGCRVVEQERR